MGREPLLANRPIIGPIWVKLRDFFTCITLVPQLHDRLEAQAAHDALIAAQLADQEARLVEQDQGQSAIIHDAGELTVQVKALRRQVAALEARLAEFESGEPAGRQP